MTFSSSTVTSITDKTGNFTFNQSSSGPTYHATGFNTSYPYLDFNGTSQGLVSSTNVSAGLTEFSANGTDTTIFLVSSPTNDYTNQYAIFGLMSQDGYYVFRCPWWVGYGNTGYILDLGGPYGGRIYETTTTPSFIGPNLFGIMRSGSSVYMYQNGSTTARASNLSATGNFSGISAQTFGIGKMNAGYFLGKISEIIIYNRALNTTEQTQINTYLGAKWGFNFASSLIPYLGRPPFLKAFAPTSISNCALWLDSADTSTLTFSSGTTVSAWKDKSGNGNNTTSFSAGTRSSAASGINNPQCSGPITNSGSSIVTIFFVASKSSYSGSYDNIIALNANTISAPINYYDAGTCFISYYGSTNPPIYYAFMNGNLSTSFNTSSFGTPFIFNAYQSGTTGTTYGNGTNFGAVGTAGNTFTYTKYYLGQCTGGSALVGNIYEVIIYNKILTNFERVQVGVYLGQKWGISSSLPDTHKFYTGSSPYTIV
jgi:hypothetical protein